MTYIAFHSRDRTTKVRGSERAHMSILISDITAAILPRGFDSNNDFLKLIPKEARSRWASLLATNADEWIRIYFSSFESWPLVYNGEEHPAREVALNTVIAMESDVMSMMAKMTGKCETHGWIDDGDRSWFADIIQKGRDNNILRPDSGWEDVIDHARVADDSALVMSYSVTDPFPNPYVAGVVGEEAVEAWYEQDDDVQWNQAFWDLRDTPWTNISPANLHTEGYLDGTTIWDAMVSPEWRTPL